MTWTVKYTKGAEQDLDDIYVCLLMDIKAFSPCIIEK